MRTTRAVTAVFTAVAATGLFGLVQATPAAAAPQCTIVLVWQNTYVAGEDSGSFSPNCQMGQGAVSNAVQQLQYDLRICYGKNIATDRIYGSQTASALRSVQSALNISVDGVYGPQSARAMKHQGVGSSSASGCRNISF